MHKETQQKKKKYTEEQEQRPHPRKFGFLLAVEVSSESWKEKHKLDKGSEGNRF